MANYHIRIETIEDDGLTGNAQSADGATKYAVQVYTDAWFAERPALTDATMHTTAADDLSSLAELKSADDVSVAFTPFIHDVRADDTAALEAAASAE